MIVEVKINICLYCLKHMKIKIEDKQALGKITHKLQNWVIYYHMEYVKLLLFLSDR